MKKKVIEALAILLLAASIAMVMTNFEWWGVNPFGPVTASDVTIAVRAEDGGLLVSDSAGERLIGVSEQRIVEWVLKSSKKEGDGGFSHIENLVSGTDGSVYLVDTYYGNGTWALKEMVKKVSADGKKIETLYELEVDEASFSGRLRNLQQWQGKIYLMETAEDGLTVRNMEDLKDTRFFSYPEADSYVRKALFHPADGTLYVMLQTGQLVTLQEDGTSTVVYDGKTEAAKRIPWSFAFGPEGELYLTDIWNREICMLSEGSLIPVLFGEEQVEADFEPDWEAVKASYAYYQIDAQNGLTTCTTDSVGFMEEDSYISQYEFPPAGKIIATGILFWAALLYAVLAAAVMAVLGIHRILTKGSSLAKLGLLVVMGTVMLTTVFAMIVLKNIQNRLSNEILKRATAMGEMVSKNIPIEELLKLQEPEDYGSKAYLAVQDAVQRGFISTDGALSDMYCVVYTLEEDVVVTRYMLEETSGCAYINEWESYAEKEVLERGVSEYYTEIGSFGSFVFNLSPILDEDGNGVGLIEVGRDLSLIQQENREMVMELYLNIVALAVVGLMIVFELLIFFSARKEYRVRRKEKGMGMVSPDMLRMLVFLIFFTINIPTGFIAIYGNRLAGDLGNIPIPRSILAAIPISAEVLTGALFSVWGGFFIRKLGQWRAGLLGGILFTAGIAVRFLPNLWLLTLGGALQGCGWGIVLLIINVMIAGMDTEEERENGFSGYNIACQNGVNAGVVFGGFLLNWLSYQYVFLISVVFGLVVIGMTAAYFTNTNTGKVEETEEVSRISLLRFLLAPRVLFYLVGILFPIVAGGYYLNYLHPVIGESLGIADTYIGYSYLLNSLSVMCLGNVLTRFMSKRLGHRISLVLASAIYAGTFVLVGFFPTLPVLILALILLGISDSFGMSIQSAYFTRLPEVEAYGYEKSMGIANLFDNLAETGGSFFFGYVLVMGLKEGLILIAVLVMALAVLFGIFGNMGKRSRRIISEEGIGREVSDR